MLRLVAALGAAWVSLVCNAPAQAQVTREYDLKAVLLHHLSRFVEWPPAVERPPDTPWVIGILGRDPFGPALDDVVRSETYRNRPIVIERHRTLATVRACQILFVSESEAANLPRILAALRNRPVLVVGDTPGFAAQGGTIEFKKSPEEKIQLRINLDAAKEAGLAISAKLLRIAEVVLGSLN